MLPSSKRLTTPLFKEVMDKGKLVHSSFFSFKLHEAKGPSRFSVAVSKKVAKTAVERNKARRRIYTAINSLSSKIASNVNGVVMVKAPAIKASFKDVVDQTTSLFVKSGILK